MVYKVRYTVDLMEIIHQEGITPEEAAEATKAIEEAATNPTKPLHRNIKQEPIRDTQGQWYRFRPSKASKYRIAFSLQRETGHLTVEGIYRRDDHTYKRIVKRFNERNKPKPSSE